MTTNRSIEYALAPPPAHWVGDGFKVHNFIPSNASIDPQRTSPFFLIDYNAKITIPPSNTPRGVGVHPHRGFETVTIVFHGKVAHHDSVGNQGTIGPGDIQWMTAASGILHKEYHEKEWSKIGGLFQMVQLWVNLPAKNKMDKPNYQTIKKESIPQIDLPKHNGTLRVIAGNYCGTLGVAKTHSPIELYIFEANKDAEIQLTFPEHYNTSFIVIEGEVCVNETNPIKTDYFVLLTNKGTTFKLTATTKSVVLIMSGEPLNEPIVSNGPFLMNNKQQIIEAYEDFQNGLFGYLED